MFVASLYIVACGVKNRVRARLRRLREPRYLLGAIAGAAYLYYTIFARMRTASVGAGRRRGRAAPPAELMTLLQGGGQMAVGLVLLAMAAVAWLMPFDSGLLDFSPAEVEFLFPAPVSRRQLLVHRLLRSQVGLLVASTVPAIFYPYGSPLNRLRWALAMWVVLVTAKVYFTGVTLVRARLSRKGGWSSPMARAPLLATLAAVLIVGRALVLAYLASPLVGVRDALARIQAATEGGPSHWLLWPFVALVRPLFTTAPLPFLAALGAALVVLAAVIAWVLASDEAFQDAAADIVEKGAEPGASRAPRYRTGGIRWTLALSGRPEGAFVWKGVQQSFRAFDRRGLLRMAVVLASLTFAAVVIAQNRGLAATAGLLATIAVGYTVMLGPQILRVDLRQDLRHLDVLKTWPVRPSAVVRGEIIWPMALLTLIAWGAVGLALFLSAAVFRYESAALRTSAALAIAILAPALVAAQLAIHNGAALMFPGWVSTGNQRARGLDAMGQRLIMLTGTLLVLALMVAPGAFAGGIVWFASRTLLGAAALVPAAVVVSGVLGLEVLLATEALGPLYEKLDLTSVELSES